MRDERRDDSSAWHLESHAGLLAAEGVARTRDRTARERNVLAVPRRQRTSPRRAGRGTAEAKRACPKGRQETGGLEKAMNNPTFQIAQHDICSAAVHIGFL